MFRKHKKEIMKNTVQETEIKEESKELNNKNFPNSISIEDLEVGKIYYRIRVSVDDTKIDKVIVAQKGIELPHNYLGWLINTDIYNFVVCYCVNTNCYSFNGDVNDLLMENHESDRGYGPFHWDSTIDTDYNNENKNLFYFDINSNITAIKNTILDYWQKLKDKVLEDKKKYYNDKLNEDISELNKNFNKSLEELK